jgi:hypothetical protein
MVLNLNADGNSSISELLVIGACIQLLTSGSEIVSAQPFNYTADEVATKLRFQQSAGTVKDSNAQTLEVCQSFDALSRMIIELIGSCSFLRSIMIGFLRIGTAARTPTLAYPHRDTVFDGYR